MDINNLINEIKSGNRRVALWGAGHLSEIALIGMVKSGIYPDIWYDRNFRKRDEGSIFGIPASSSDFVFDEKKDTSFFLAISYDFTKIKRKLNDAGYSRVYGIKELVELVNIYNYADDFYHSEYEGNLVGKIEKLDSFRLHEPAKEYERLKSKYSLIFDQQKKEDFQYMDSFLIVQGTKCNLRCRDCCAEIPYYEKGEVYDKNKIIECVDRIARSVDIIGNVGFSGGEPFMYDNTLELVKEVSKHENILKIHISTNGGILINEDMFKELRKYGVSLMISDYGIIAKNREEFIKLAVKHLPETKSNTKKQKQDDVIVEKPKNWVDFGSFKKRYYSKSELYEQSNICSCRRIIVLNDTKLYNCWRSVACMKLGILPEQENEVIDVLSPNITNEEFKKRLKLMADYSVDLQPLRACDYCNGYFNVTDMPVAKQIDHRMDPYEKDWT